jgi:hypothetical protein
VPRVASALFVVNVEANMAYVAPSVEKYLRANPSGLPQTTFMMEDVRQRKRVGAIPEITAGTRTTHENKLEMVEKFSRLLRDDHIRFYNNFVVLPDTVINKEFPHPREAICREIKTLVREVKYKNKSSGDDAYTRPTIRYRPEKGENYNDFFMSIAINTLQREIFLRSDRYRNSRAM